MEIILLEYIEKVGDKHEVVKVKNGYGRNYLIPKGLAIVANKTNMARLEGLKKQFAKKETAKVDTYREYADKLTAATLKIVAKAGETGRLFGSVKAQHLIDTIQEDLGFEVERRVIQMPDEVKDLGSYEAIFKFHEDVVATVKFDVVRDKSEETAEAKAAETRVAETRSAEAEMPAAAETVEITPAAEPAPMDVAEAAEELAEAEPEAAETIAEETIEAVAGEPDQAPAEETVADVVAEESAEIATDTAEMETEAEKEDLADTEETPAGSGDETDDTDKAA